MVLVLLRRFPKVLVLVLGRNFGIAHLCAAQLLCIDMGIGVLTIQKSLKFFKIGIKSCWKHKNYVALDCGLGDRGPMDPRGVPWGPYLLKRSLGPHNFWVFYINI